MGDVVGRSKELQVVREFLDGLLPGQGALLFAGDVGIGKTAIWSATVNDARGAEELVQSAVVLGDPDHAGEVTAHRNRRRRGRPRGRKRQGDPGAGVDRTSAPSSDVGSGRGALIPIRAGCYAS